MKNDYAQAIVTTGRIIDAWLPWKIQYDRTPGLSVGIVHKGKLVYKNGFGFADLELQKPATAKTCYRIASISKTFTAVAIMQLVERNKLALDDKAITYLPWLKIKNKGLNSRAITIRNLLSHTAGVFRDGTTPHWASDAFPDRTALKKSILDKTLVFENSTCFKYSNFGFAVLGEIIRKASGMPYEQYVSDHICAKLRMHHTAPDFDETMSQWLAKGYGRVIPNAERDCFQHCATHAYSPATGFLSNVEDLAVYLGSLSLVRDDKRILTRESKKELFREHWPTGKENKSYGLGFDVEQCENRKITGHGGGFPGFITRMSLDLKYDIGVIVLSNTSESSSVAITEGVFKTIYAVFDMIGNDNHHEMQKASFSNYKGLYRNRSEDAVVVNAGPHLISFNPQTSSPLAKASTLLPHKKNVFLMKTFSNYNSPGEYATFVGASGREKAQRLIWGSTPLERVM